jgi:hypothetical protein
MKRDDDEHRNNIKCILHPTVDRLQKFKINAARRLHAVTDTFIIPHEIMAFDIAKKVV